MAVVARKTEYEGLRKPAFLSELSIEEMVSGDNKYDRSKKVFNKQFEEMSNQFKTLFYNRDVKKLDSDFEIANNFLDSGFDIKGLKQELDRLNQDYYDIKVREDSYNGGIISRLFKKGFWKPNFADKKRELKEKAEEIRNKIVEYSENLNHMRDSSKQELFSFGNSEEKGDNRNLREVLANYEKIVDNMSRPDNSNYSHYLRRVYNWGLDVPLTKEERGRTMRGEDFTSEDFNENFSHYYESDKERNVEIKRTYRRNYFIQEKKDWHDNLESDIIDNVLKFSRTYSILKKYDSDFKKLNSKFKSRQNDLRNMLSRLDRYDFKI